MFSAYRALLLVCSLALLVGCGEGGRRQDASVTDQDHGRAVYAANCAVCHGATGLEGGLGPSLRDEKSRMDLSRTMSWIKDPKPPMPKLYPENLTDDDVRDVAQYVNSL